MNKKTSGFTDANKCSKCSFELPIWVNYCPKCGVIHPTGDSSKHTSAPEKINVEKPAKTEQSASAAQSVTKVKPEHVPQPITITQPETAAQTEMLAQPAVPTVQTDPALDTLTSNSGPARGSSYIQAPPPLVENKSTRKGRWILLILVIVAFFIWYAKPLLSP